MTVLLPLGLLALGFVLMVKGADWLVLGASAIARLIGMSELAIGLTIVSFGTSMPELLVNIIASMQGNNDIAIGNIVGSNIANTLLVLGAATSFGVLYVKSSTVWNEIPFSLLAAIVLLVVLNDALIDGTGVPRMLTRSEGTILMLFFVIFLYYTFSLRREELSGGSEGSLSSLTAIGLFLLGCVLLPIGGKFVVDAAAALARQLGVSEAFIGLSLVALGTSLPEVATSCIAVRRGKADIAVGNVVGSNIFNIFWILGLSAIISPIAFNPAMNVDLLVVIVSSILLFLLVHRGPLHRRIFLFWRERRPEYILVKHEGLMLLLGYIAYLAYIAVRG